MNVDLVEVAYQVSIGLVGAGVLASATFAFKIVRGAMLNRRFPVAGLYRSTFEDVEDGKTVYTKAIAEFHQRGRKVWGPTQEIGTNRKWLLEGDIDRSGRIHGRYVADDPHDIGLGAFFLEMLPDHSLEGMWTGYDSENKTVSAGRYLFRRMKRVVCRGMTVADIPEALSVLGNSLGARYISREELTEYAEDVEKVAYVASTSLDTGVVAAATGLIPSSTKDLMSMFPEDQAEKVSDLVPELAFNRTGLLKSVAVDSHARGTGVGTEISRTVVDALFAKGATSIISIGWMDGEGCHIQGPLETLGFAARGDVNDFWMADSIREGYSCPTCGRPCRCSARIFVLAISSARSTKLRSKHVKQRRLPAGP